MATNGSEAASIDLAPITGGPAAVPTDLMDSPRGWLVTAVAFLGMFLSMGVLVVYSFGVLATAMAEDFGIGFSQLATIFMVYSLSVVVACPVWGMLVDRFGGRKIVIISSFMLAVLFCLLTVLPRNAAYVYATFIAIGLFASGTLPAPYASIVVGWFEKRRGLALGVTMMGIGAGAAAIPPLSATLLAHFGWRNTFLLYALLIVFVCIPMMFAFLKPHPAAVSTRVASLNEPRSNVLKQAAAMPTTWILAIFALLTGLIMVGSVTTFVPMLQSQGMSRAQAASYQAIVGISLVLGRIIVGGLIDRIFAPRVMMAVLAITSLGYFSMYGASSPATYALSAAGIGLAIGAEMDFLAFLVSRYYAKPAFGTLFGFFFAMYALGAAFGPLTVSWLAGTLGSYQPGLLVLGVCTAVLMLSMLLLPRYAQQESIRS